MYVHICCKCVEPLCTQFQSIMVYSTLLVPAKITEDHLGVCKNTPTYKGKRRIGDRGHIQINNLSSRYNWEEEGGRGMQGRK